MRLFFVLTLLASCTLLGCSDSNSTTTGGGIIVPSEFAFFSEAGGRNLTMVSRGGMGITGNGGSGGEFYVYAYSSGDIMVVPNGTVTTDYTIPDVRPELGTNPRSVTANETIQPTPNGTSILGDDGVNPATGLWVAPGVTLTLLPNNDQFTGGVFSRVSLTVEDGVVVEGAIVVAPGDDAVFDDGLGNYTANLLITADNFWMAATGSIDARGDDSPAATGADGGGVEFNVEGNIVSYGPVDTSGGNGVTGAGSGGDVDFTSSVYGCYNLGNVDTSGGTATGPDTTGGAAGDIEMYGDYGAVVNKGRLTAVGGNGPAGGGAGGDVNLETEEIGMLVNAADIDTSGGDATTGGAGGNGGDIYLESCSGTLRATGAFVSRGGNGLAMGNGGNGGDITFYIDDCDYIDEEYVVGGMFVGCGLDASGGNGANGGNGGDLNFEPDQDELYKPGLQPTIICGSTVIDVCGGDGAVNGGSASDSEIYNDGAYDENDTEYLHDIHMQVNVLARGGNGTSGSGGSGGDFCIDQDDEVYGPLYDRMIRNTANFDLRGGSGATTGGSGGDFFMFDHYHCANLGNIDTSGGTGGSGNGGAGGEIEIYSDDVVSCAGTLNTNGGASTSGAGGSADDISVEGRFNEVSGTYNSRGGDSATGAGGSGGTFDVFGTERRTPASGSADVREGAGGASDGTEGEVWVDGTKLPLTNGVTTLR